MSGNTSENLSGKIDLGELIFKVLSASIVPALIWVNSISVDTALLKQRVDAADSRLKQLETDQKTTLDTVRENQANLKELKGIMGIVQDLLKEIRDDLKQK